MVITCDLYIVCAFLKVRYNVQAAWIILNIWAFLERDVMYEHVMKYIVFDNPLILDVMYGHHLRCMLYVMCKHHSKWDVMLSTTWNVHNIWALHEMYVMFNYHLKWGVMEEHSLHDMVLMFELYMNRYEMLSITRNVHKFEHNFYVS